MEKENQIGKLLSLLSFTNKEIAEFVGVSESMIKKMRTGIKVGSSKVQKKIIAFVRVKIEQINILLFTLD